MGTSKLVPTSAIQQYKERRESLSYFEARGMKPVTDQQQGLYLVNRIDDRGRNELNLIRWREKYGHGN